MTIRVAIIGFGTSGRIFHAPFLAANPDYHVAAIVTRDPSRRRLAEREYPGAKLLDAATDLWATARDYDLVVIGSPSGTHESLATTALAAGLHVVVDKPFALTSAGGRALITQSEAAHRKLTVFQNRRWDGDFLTVKRLIGEGKLGEVTRFESRFEWWKPEAPESWKTLAGRADGGGILYDLGAHLIDQALQLFGPVANVYVESDKRRPDVNAEDDVFVALAHENGARSHLWMNAVAPGEAPRFHVQGSSAAYTSWGLDGQEAALIAGSRPLEEGFGETSAERWGTLERGTEKDRVRTERGDYGTFYRVLAESLNGDGPVPVDPADAVAALEIIELTFEQSAWPGRP